MCALIDHWDLYWLRWKPVKTCETTRTHHTITSDHLCCRCLGSSKETEMVPLFRSLLSHFMDLDALTSNLWEQSDTNVSFFTSRNLKSTFEYASKELLSEYSFGRPLISIREIWFSFSCCWNPFTKIDRGVAHNLWKTISTLKTAYINVNSYC